MSVNLLKSICEKEGSLFPIEFKDLNFIPKRIFYITNVPRLETRGKHAHYTTKQYIICVAGLINVRTHDGISWTEKLLQPGYSLLIPELIWDEQTYLTGNDILLSICSTEYNKNDYITDFDNFKRGNI